MTTLTPIDAQALARRLKAGELTLIDIREPDEFAREHINGAVSLPLSRLEAGHVALRGATPVAFTCRTGMSTNSNCDRLAAHVDAARAHVADPAPVGRKLDFLMQEFMREANTLCSKAQSLALTRIGLDLKTVIDQMREQVQNVE